MRRTLVLLAGAAVLAAGCGGDEGEGDAATGAAPSPAATAAPQEEAPAAGASSGGGAVVDMTDALQFEPKTITVAAGKRVRWRNAGKIAHTVTTAPSKVADPANVESPTGAETFDSGLLGEGEEFSRRFTEPGTYRYVCIPHEGTAMVGTVVVEP